MVSATPDGTNAAWRALGTRLAAYRKAADFTQESLAGHEAIHYGRSTIANVEIGRQAIGRDFWASCDAVLGTGTMFSDEYDRIARDARKRLRTESSGARPGKAAHPSLGNAVISGAIPSFLPDEPFLPDPVADVDHWQETVWEYGYSHITASREDLLTDLCADQAAASGQLAIHLAAGDPRAEPMATVTAQLTALMALACTDLGYSRQACHLWRFARRYAEVSKVDSVRLWISGHEIISGIYQRRPLPVLAELARRAMTVGHHAPPSPGKAQLLAGYAQLLSLTGRTDEAQDALSGLQETYDSLPGSVTELRDSFFGWPEHRLHHVVSFTHSAAGTIAKASAAQDAALRLYPARYRIGRCQIELHRARCLVLDGHIGDGLRHAVRKLAEVDVPRRAEFVLVAADRVSAAVPPSEQSRPEAREFAELLALSRSAQRR